MGLKPGSKPEENSSADEAPTQTLDAPDQDPDARVCPRCGQEAHDKYCPGCGLHLAVEPELPTRLQWKHDHAPAPAAAAPQAPAQAGSVDGGERTALWLKVLVPLIGLVAVAALAVAIVSYVANRPDDSLRSQLSSVRQQLAAEQTTVTSIKANSQAGAVAGLQAQMQKLTTCIPEMQQEIGGLNVNTSSQNGWLTTAFLQNPTIVSSNCTKVLNGPNSSNGP